MILTVNTTDMRNLLVIVIIFMSACSKGTEPGIFQIGVWEQQNVNTMSFVIDIETDQFDYDEDFYIELVVFAKPITSLISEENWIESIDLPSYHKSVILTCQDFILCNGKLVYRLGHQFTQQFDSSKYYLDYEVATEHEYIGRVMH